MKKRFALDLFSAICAFILLLPGRSEAGKFVINRINVAIRPLTRGEFALHVQFALQDLPAEMLLPNSTIDYAELKFDVQVLSARPPLEVGWGRFEILAADTDGKTPLPGLPYNDRAATGRLRLKQVGSEDIKIDITELVEQWVRAGLPNNGLLLVSSRRAVNKVFRAGIVSLPQNFTLPSVTIFYTNND